jgi:Na+-driven multidrug efflux pump
VGEQRLKAKGSERASSMAELPQDSAAKASARLTGGGLVRQSLGLGAPLAIGMFAHGLFNLVDMLVVARLGPGAVASVTLGGIILPLGFLVFDGLSTATVERLSRALGRGEVQRAQEIAEESLRLALLASLLGAIVFGAGAPLLVGFVDSGHAEMTAHAISYLAIMGYGMAGMFLILQVTAIQRAAGSGRWPLFMLVGANALNLVLALGLVHGNFFMPRLGVAGAAWATVMAQGVFATLGLLSLVRGSAGLRIRRGWMFGSLPSLKGLLAQGLPTSLQLAVRVLAVFVLLRIARSTVHGSADAFLDGVGLCVRLEMLAVFVALGFGAAATPFVAQNRAAGDAVRAARGTWVLALAAAVAGALIAWLLAVFTEPVLTFIMPGIESEAMAAAHAYLHLLLPVLPAVSLAVVLARGLNGAGSTRTALVVDLMLYGLVLTALAHFASTTEHAEPVDIWLRVAIVHLSACVIYVLIWSLGRWKHRPIWDAPSGGS